MNGKYDLDWQQATHVLDLLQHLNTGIHNEERGMGMGLCEYLKKNDTWTEWKSVPGGMET